MSTAMGLQVYYATLTQVDTAQAQHQEEGQVAGQQAERDRGNVLQALQALSNILQGVPKLTALMASRSALTPLLNCIEPICRSACPKSQYHSYHRYTTMIMTTIPILTVNTVEILL